MASLPFTSCEAFPTCLPMADLFGNNWVSIHYVLGFILGVCYGDSRGLQAQKISKSLDSYIPEKTSGNTDIAKWLRPLAALPEFLGSIPSTHMLVQDVLILGDPMPFSGL